MAVVRVTKEFRWEMAHALWNYDGLCKNVHGHSYILYVTVIGNVINDAGNIKDGMVIDFGDISKVVKNTIVDRYDHCLLLNRNAPHQPFLQMPQMFDKLELTDFQPTCENIVVMYARMLADKLPDGVKLHSIKLYETAKSRNNFV